MNGPERYPYTPASAEWRTEGRAASYVKVTLCYLKNRDPYDPDFGISSHQKDYSNPIDTLTSTHAWARHWQGFQSNFLTNNVVLKGIVKPNPAPSVKRSRPFSAMV